MNAAPDSAAMSLDIVLLRTFLEVADRRGFAPAAERLALTPSAVSGHIKRLEQATGAVLLARTTRRVELTQAGETLYAYARNIVEMEREARARLRGCAARRCMAGCASARRRISPARGCRRCCTRSAGCIRARRSN